MIESLVENYLNVNNEFLRDKICNFLIKLCHENNDLYFILVKKDFIFRPFNSNDV